MWDVKCGCNPINEPFEFKICDATYINPSRIELPYGNDSDLCALQNKILNDYCDILNKLECGIQLDLELILEKISIMDINNNCSFNSLKQVYQSDSLSQGCLENEYLLELIDNTREALTKLLNKKIGYVYKDEESERYLGFSSRDSYNIYKNTDNDSLILATWDINSSGIGYVLYDKENNRYIAFKDVESYNEYIADTSKEELIIAWWLAPSNSNKIGYVTYDNNTLYFYSSLESYDNGENPLSSVTINSNILEIISTINEKVSSIESSIGDNNLQGTIKGRITNLESKTGTLESATSNLVSRTTALESVTSNLLTRTSALGDRTDALERNLSELDNTYATDSALSEAQNALNGRIEAINTFLGSLIQISNYTVPDNTRMVESYLKITINSPNNSSNKELIIKVWNPEGIELCTVTFNTNGGNFTTLQDLSITVNKGATISLPTNITKDGFIFNGWHLNNPTGTKVNNNYTVLSSITLYAGWDEETNYLYALYNGEPENFDGRFYQANQTMSFGSLEGWNEWSSNTPLYIVIPKKGNSGNITDYIEILSAFGDNLIKNTGFILDTIIENKFFIKWNYKMSRFGGGNSEASIIFKL